MAEAFLVDAVPQPGRPTRRLGWLNLGSPSYVTPPAGG
jgi:hypothetical protein